MVSADPSAKSFNFCGSCRENPLFPKEKVQRSNQIAIKEGVCALKAYISCSKGRGHRATWKPAKTNHQANMAHPLASSNFRTRRQIVQRPNETLLGTHGNPRSPPSLSTRLKPQDEKRCRPKAFSEPLSRRARLRISLGQAKGKT